VVGLSLSGGSAAYPALMAEAYKYLVNRSTRGSKPNFEAQLAAPFAYPAEGIQDNTVNRLLLMSSWEHHLASVPMAFYLERPKASLPVAPLR
jgi:hypothetical protein